MLDDGATRDLSPGKPFLLSEICWKLCWHNNEDELKAAKILVFVYENRTNADKFMLHSKLQFFSGSAIVGPQLCIKTWLNLAPG